MPVPDPHDVQQVLIVVGAHLRAEIADRPLAYQLADAIRLWRSDHAAWLNINLEPVVLTDLWYLNNEDLQLKPTISLGGPGVNALSNAFSKTIEQAIAKPPEDGSLQEDGHPQESGHPQENGGPQEDANRDQDVSAGDETASEQTPDFDLELDQPDASEADQTPLKSPSADEPTVLIQFDPEYTDLRCCIWGTDHALTVKGVDLFIEDYLDRFLRAVATQVEPKVD